MRLAAILLCLAVALPTAAAAGTGDYIPRMWNCKPIASEKAVAERMKVFATAKLIAHLKDPESARLGEARYVRTVCDEAAYDIVCGSVNARNSYGGYTGAGPWVYIGSKERWWILTDESQAVGELQALLDAMKVCAKAAKAL